MKRILLVSLALVLPLAGAASGAEPRVHDLGALPERTPFTAEPFTVGAPSDSLHSCRFLVVDLDGDGRQDLVADTPEGFGAFAWRDGRPVQLWSWTAPPQFRRPWPGIFMDGAWDVNADGLPEIVTTAVSRDMKEWRLWVFDPRARRMLLDIPLPLGPDRRADNWWDGAWLVIGVLPAEPAGGGKPAIPPGIVLRCRTRYDFDFRQIRVLNPDGSLRWKRGLGPNPHYFGLRDINGDGGVEIIAVGDSPGNMHGVQIEGTADDKALLLVLDAHGRELWSRELGPEAVGTYLDTGDVNGDGRAEIVTAINSKASGWQHRVCVWSGAGDLILERILLETPHDMAIWPADLGIPERPASIYLGGREGSVRRLDWIKGELVEVARGEAPGGFSIYDALDILPAPGPEIIARSRGHDYLILREDLTPLAVVPDFKSYLLTHLPLFLWPDARVAIWDVAPGERVLMVEDPGAGIRFASQP